VIVQVVPYGPRRVPLHVRGVLLQPCATALRVQHRHGRAHGRRHGRRRGRRGVGTRGGTTSSMLEIACVVSPNPHNLSNVGIELSHASRNW
jgi:hypothetical protein